MQENDQQIENYITYLLAQAHRKLHLDLEKSLKKEGMQVEHWRILEILSNKHGQIAGDLAKIVLMNPPALTKMIDRMVANGYVHRLVDNIDQRKIRIFITDRGYEVFLRLQDLANDQNNNMIDRFGDKKMQRLKTLLNQLILS